MRSRTPPPLALYPDISENERDLAGARKAARELRKQNKEEAVTEASTRSSTAASSGSVGGGAAGAGERAVDGQGMAAVGELTNPDSDDGGDDR